MTPCRQNLLRLLAFTASIIVVGLGLSAVAKLWVPLSWWVIFRRCVSIAASVSLVVFMWRVHHQTIRSLGLGPWNPLGRRHFIRGALLGCGTIALMAAIYLGSGICRIGIHPDTTRVWMTLLAFIPAAGLIGVLEELIFRGYILQQLMACSKWLAVAGSSAAYAVVHLRAVPVWPQSGFELTGLFILGVVLALGTLRTKQLYLAIGLHASMAYWARLNKLLIAFPSHSPLQWLVGTSRLVNGLIAWLVLGLLGLALMRDASARRAASS